MATCPHCLNWFLPAARAKQVNKSLFSSSFSAIIEKEQKELKRSKTILDSYKNEFINFISNCLPGSLKMTSWFRRSKGCHSPYCHKPVQDPVRCKNSKFVFSLQSTIIGHEGEWFGILFHLTKPCWTSPT